MVPPAGKVLVPGTGHFSESWAVQAEALGRQVLRTPWVEGLPTSTTSDCRPGRRRGHRRAGRCSTRPDLGLIPHQAASASGRWDLLRPTLSAAGNGGSIIRVHP